MIALHNTQLETRSAASRKAPRTALNGLLHRIAAWRSRRALAALTTDQLHDIGLSRDAADKEAHRGIWDAPANWRC
ncbi:Uncharacterized conserved protein YjiS, DUF1127 family [Sulfitobacter brevis]|uniref:Uncharacterized conserved protein YjiS, DUF1127 family n=1 Tax=Sulfitobacter brevis TaxID=74348 RepID=A0A1I2EIM0_9RHOB|nr:DUF1127 domain-containing protein [Sulfitobacter brevis]SFE92261.1 Uncharacterized conserved protein YjiS, DUF1127 family [Sulfitobacter brevis]